jgi:hypothetical protein
MDYNPAPVIEQTSYKQPSVVRNRTTQDQEVDLRREQVKRFLSSISHWQTPEYLR